MTCKRKVIDMKLSNFKLIGIIGHNAVTWKFRATVDVSITTGFIFKTTLTKQREIFKSYGGNWHFSDTGDFTPGFQAENLARAFEARMGADIHHCEVDI